MVEVHPGVDDRHGDAAGAGADIPGRRGVDIGARRAAALAGVVERPLLPEAGIVRRLVDVDDAIGLDEGDVGPSGEALPGLFDRHRRGDELETGDHPERLQAAPIDPGHRRRATRGRGIAAEPDEQPAWGRITGRRGSGGCLPDRRRHGRRTRMGVLMGHGGRRRETEREQRDERGRSGVPGLGRRHAASDISGTRPGIRSMVAAGWVGNRRPSINHPGGGGLTLVRRRREGAGRIARPPAVSRGPRRSVVSASLRRWRHQAADRVGLVARRIDRVDQRVAAQDDVGDDDPGHGLRQRALVVGLA